MPLEVELNMSRFLNVQRLLVGVDPDSAIISAKCKQNRRLARSNLQVNYHCVQDVDTKLCSLNTKWQALCKRCFEERGSTCFLWVKR